MALARSAGLPLPPPQREGSWTGSPLYVALIQAQSRMSHATIMSRRPKDRGPVPPVFGRTPRSAAADGAR